MMRSTTQIYWENQNILLYAFMEYTVHDLLLISNTANFKNCGEILLFSYMMHLSYKDNMGQYGRNLADEIVKFIFVNEKCSILIQKSPTSVPLFQITINQHWFR